MSDERSGLIHHESGYTDSTDNNMDDQPVSASKSRIKVILQFVIKNCISYQ